MPSNRKDRSRSPVRVDSVGRRRDGKSYDVYGRPQQSDIQNVSQMNPMIMTNMYSQGNMMMGGGMYPNMMMPGTMMGSNMMQSPGMEMIQGTGMEIMPQTSMDMSTISNQAVPSTGSNMDLTVMSGVMMDPSLMAMYPSMNMGMSQMAEKKEIVFKQCKLIPPTGGSQPPNKTRPPGCRTIFVGGLPDKIKEATVREIFESYGRIHTLRLSKKNFCHIRFDREECVDAAILLSGYRLTLITGSKDDEVSEDDRSMSGWLHVDFAMSRDDQNDYERSQRMVLRVQQQQLQQMNAQQEMVSRSMSVGSSYKRSPSPPRVLQYSTGAMVQLAEKIKSEQHFASALPTLLSWLERGECSKRNFNQFYSMIQTANAHIRRLFGEKMQAEEELQEVKEKVKTQIAKVIEQLEQVGKLFVAACHQRVWDHFTKPQRKNIETWQKMTQEFNILKDEFNEKFSDDGDFNGFSANKGFDNDESEQLKRENESLRFQLEAYKNEVDVIKMDAEKEMEKFKAQYIARQALQGVKDNIPLVPPLPTTKMPVPPPPPLPDNLDDKVHLKTAVEAGCGEAKLIGVMSAFLQVHPQGASLDYVVSYVRALFPHVSQATVHHVLQKHHDVFNRNTTGVGANIEHRWTFVAFNKDGNKK